MAFIKNSDKLVEGLVNKFFTEQRAKDAVQSDLDNLSQQIQSEQSRAEGAEGQLSGRLDTLEGSGPGSVQKAQTDAQNYADSAVQSEQSRAQGAESQLSGRLDTLEGSGPGSVQQAEQNAKDYADQQVAQEASDRQAAVSGEQQRAEGAESALSGRLDVIEGSGAGSVAKAEADAKAYADQKVADLINGAPAMLDTLKEIADQLASDESAVSALTNTVAANLQTAKDYADAQVSSEASARQTAVNNEATARQNAVSQEASARQSADSALSGRLDVIEGSGEGSVLKAKNDAKSYADGIVASEQSARQAADSALDGRVSALESDKTTKTYVDQQVAAEAQARQDEDATFFKLDGSRAMTGGLKVKHSEKSANYALQSSDYIIGVTAVSGGKTMTLPSASTMGAGKMFVIKDQSGGASAANYIRIACQAGQTVDGSSTYDLDAPYESVTVVSNGSHWFIM